MYLLFVSQNADKTAEAQRIFLNSNYQLLTLKQTALLKKLGVKIPAGLEVAETGKTLEENALIKARAFHQLTQLPCIADDSGLFLDVFPDFPGVNSNRWFVSSNQGRNLALLEKLKNQDNRQAKFQTVLCLYAFKNEKPLFFNGEIKGQIANKPRGQEGFGYDPIFIPDGYQESFAQLGLTVKNKISHRARAWANLINYLEQN
jgi:XTP/dITP diphosphohydrolase